MKTLTIKQPWAYLILAGIKDLENRTWKTNFRGRVLIHAGAKPANFKPEMENQCTAQEITIFSALNHAEENDLFGAIVGSIEIVDCVRNHPSIWAEKERWHWVLKKPILFKKPVRNVKGKLSFWESGVEVCHICGQPANVICGDCGEYFCPRCSAPYIQVTDYDCCKKCEQYKIK
ncbi:MAG: ASCH domain-containing protein [Prevotellaceae bacterium]|jgi:hypothetical protein|nr:ASCH domain-containing protein [Prevotellaceae bacterium]